MQIFIHLSGKLAHHFFSQSFAHFLHVHSLTVLSMYLPGQLHITWYGEDLPCIYSTQDGVLKYRHKAGFCCILEGHEGCWLQVHVMPSRGILKDLSLKSANNTHIDYKQYETKSYLLLTISKIYFTQCLANSNLLINTSDDFWNFHISASTCIPGVNISHPFSSSSQTPSLFSQL